VANVQMAASENGVLLDALEKMPRKLVEPTMEEVVQTVTVYEPVRPKSDDNLIDNGDGDGDAVCGCEVAGESFCNFDGGSTGECESCSSFSSIESCSNEGLPAAGAADCALRCFGKDGDWWDEAAINDLLDKHGMSLMALAAIIAAVLVPLCCCCIGWCFFRGRKSTAAAAAAGEKNPTTTPCTTSV
jgi:hypothetical protein